MIEEFMNDPMLTVGLFLSLIAAALGLIKRDSVLIFARAFANSALAAKIMTFLKSEYSDDIVNILNDSKLPYVLDLAKKDEETLKAVCEVAAKANMKGIADVILFYNSKMKDYEFVNEEMPDKYEKILTEKLSKAILNKE